MTSVREPRSAAADRVSLPFDAWPVADRQMLLDAFANRDVFDRGALAHLSESSRRTITWCYGVWLRWNADVRPEALADAPASRAHRTVLVAYARHLAAEGHTRTTMEGYLKSISRLLAAAGDHTAGERVRGLWRVGTVRRETANRIATSHRLVAIGLRIIDEAVAGGPIAEENALTCRNGLLVALLAAVPLRRSNFAALELGRSLFDHGHVFRVSMEPEYTKSRKRIDLIVPDVATPALRHYLDTIRPLLPGAAGSAFLWPSARGAHLTADRIYNIVASLTHEVLGVRLSPHAFRDAAATTIALQAPERIAVARDLLGHSNQETTDRHYIRARGVETSRRVDEIVRRIRVGVPLRHGRT